MQLDAIVKPNSSDTYSWSSDIFSIEIDLDTGSAKYQGVDGKSDEGYLIQQLFQSWFDQGLIRFGYRKPKKGQFQPMRYCVDTYGLLPRLYETAKGAKVTGACGEPLTFLPIKKKVRPNTRRREDDEAALQDASIVNSSGYINPKQGH